MFGWFRSRPRSPVESAVREWIDGRWQWLLDQFGVNRVQSVSVVFPTSQYFPDPYDGTEAAVRRMLDRVCGYMGIDPGTISMSLYREKSPLLGGRTQGTAGIYLQEDGRFRIGIEMSNLSDPLALVAAMAHEISHVHLLGHGRLWNDAPDHEPLADLLTVFLGMGVFSANAVIREHYWTEGHYGGWMIGRQGYLGMPEYGYAFALFARSRHEDGSEWSGDLRPDVRSAFKQAMRFLAAVDNEGAAAMAGD